VLVSSFVTSKFQLSVNRQGSIAVVGDDEVLAKPEAQGGRQFVIGISRSKVCR